MNEGLKKVTRLEVLQAIRDTDGHDLFYSIACDRISTRKLKMSRKQYYVRLSKLIKANMIKRKNGKYLLTPFGKVIYGVHSNLSRR
jgi:hypothetical protein